MNAMVKAIYLIALDIGDVKTFWRIVSDTVMVDVTVRSLWSSNIVARGIHWHQLVQDTSLVVM